VIYASSVVYFASKSLLKTWW